MKIKLKNIAIYTLISIALLLLGCLIKVGAGFTNSGIISFYGIEIVGLCVIAFILFYIIKNWSAISRENRIFLLITSIFLFYCFADYTVRIFTKGFELKSILVIESNLFVMGFMFIILFKIIPLKRVIDSICFFSCILGVISVVLYYFMESGLSNTLYLNHATRTFLLGVLLPLTLYKYVKDKDRFSSICFYIHLATLIFCGLVSGARVNYVMIPLLIVVTLIILMRNKMASFIKIIISIMLPIILVFVSANFYIYAYAQMTRLPVTNVIIKAFNITYNGVTSDSIDSSLSDLIKELNSSNKTEQEKEELYNLITIKAAKLSTGESTSIRLYAWEQSIKDIKKDPLFGIGLQQYSSTSSDGQLTVPIQPHNFILEYTLSFGLIGFMLWVVMFFSPLFSAYRSVRFKIRNSNSGQCCAASILFALSGAFFQPYFLFPCVMVFIYALIGCYALSIKQEGIEKNI